MKAQPHIVDMEDLPEYPLNGSVRLDSHWFITWERRRWLNSDMRLKATPECRALYFDLIDDNIVEHFIVIGRGAPARLFQGYIQAMAR